MLRQRQPTENPAQWQRRGRGGLGQSEEGEAEYGGHGEAHESVEN